MSMAPASTMAWMEFAADISGVCSIDGTLLMTSKPTSRLRTKMVTSAIRAWLIGSTSGGWRGLEKFRHGWIDHFARVRDDDAGLDRVGGGAGLPAAADHLRQHPPCAPGGSRGGAGGPGVTGRPGAEPGGGADRLQARDARAEYEHLGRPRGAGRGDEQREEACEGAGRDEHGLVARDVGLRRQRVHGLRRRPGPRDAVEADRGHPGRAALAGQLSLRDRAEHADHRLAGRQPGAVRCRWSADEQQDVALVEQFLVADDPAAALGLAVVGEQYGGP